MRVTFVHKTANFSGGNRVVATYAERLAQRGHQVCVVTGPGERPRPLRKVINRWKGRSFSASDGRSWLDELQLEHRVLTSAGPPRAEDVPDADVIVATWWETAEWIAALPASKGAKAYFLQGVEWTIDDMPRERVRQTWRLPLHKIVIAEFMADIARVDFGDSDLSHVPNAVDTQLFHAPPRERNAVPTVGLMDVGPLAIKGGDITRAALLLAKQQLPELRGVCFGRSHPPPERALPSWVSMQLSPTPEALRALYASCDVFIHASRAEGFGLPLLEAMACRTPVAATPAGAAPELLPSGGGLLVPHDDPAALASALVRVCTLPRDEWRARSDAAFTRATTYTLDDATQRMEAALERAITKAQRGEHARASARGDAGPVPSLASQVHQLAQGMGSRQTDVGSAPAAPRAARGSTRGRAGARGRAVPRLGVDATDARRPAHALAPVASTSPRTPARCWTR
jgi:glycosyltransferase involved in cell wall biosynthesis